HEQSLVVDTQGQFGPTVHTPGMLARLDELADAGAAPAAFVVETEDLVRRALLGDDLPGFWDGWDEAGVDVTCVTIGAFGERPWTYQNAVRDAALFTELFDGLSGRLAKVTTAADFEAVKREGRRGVLLNFQNTVCIGDDLDRLEQFHGMGVR